MREYITKHFGTITGCASELGVTRQAVQNWIRRSPRGILKHAPEIVAMKNTTHLELEGEVLHRESILANAEPAKP